jgi:hypothetical protein
MGPPDQQTVSALTELFEKALQGGLGVKQLYSAWPGAMNDEPVMPVFFEDILDGVEHTPDPKHWGEWRKTCEYWLMYLDLCLLRSRSDVTIIANCRDSLENKLGPWRDLTEQSVVKVVEQCVEGSSRRM